MKAQFAFLTLPYFIFTLLYFILCFRCTYFMFGCNFSLPRNFSSPPIHALVKVKGELATVFPTESRDG